MRKRSFIIFRKYYETKSFPKAAYATRPVLPELHEGFLPYYWIRINRQYSGHALSSRRHECRQCANFSF